MQENKKPPSGNRRGLFRGVDTHFGAVIDWYSRRGLARRYANTLTADFCGEAVYLKTYDFVFTAKGGQDHCIECCNIRWLYPSVVGKAPDMIYFAGLPINALCMNPALPSA